MKKIYLIAIVIIITGLVIYYSDQAETPQKNIGQSTKKASLVPMSGFLPIKEKQDPEVFIIDCIETLFVEKMAVSEQKKFSALLTSKLKSITPSNLLWQNIHFKNSQGVIYRLRKFNDDGDEGPVEKLILYKENETEFPEMEKVYYENINDIMRKILADVEIIHHERAYHLQFDGIGVFVKILNDEIDEIKMTVGSIDQSCYKKN